ncbi:MAG TPA: response regulator [Bryobacteraceae bacterium]|nr:response regulator [Bryobacteraceae bacterium]
MQPLSAEILNLLSSRNPDRLVRAIFDFAAAPLGMDIYFHYTVGKSGNVLELTSWAGIREEAARRVYYLPFGQSISGTVAQTRAGIVAIDIQNSHDDQTAIARDFGIRVCVCDPLVSGQRLLGTLLFGSRTRDDFNQRDLELLHAVSHYVETTIERLQMMDRLQHHAELLDLAQDAILSLRLDGTVEFWSKGAERTYGWTAEEAVGTISHDLLRTQFPDSLQKLHAILLERGTWQGELIHTRKDGTVLTLSSRWALRRDLNGRPVGFLEINRDITERKLFEEQLRQTAKLESLGVLAGGIAHDFNNLLVGILGNASLVADSLPETNENHRLLKEVVVASERAAALTRQLLAYAGKGRFETHSIDLSELVREIAGLVQAAIPKNVQVHLSLAPDLPAIEVDVAQIQQVIMNLVINGAEAIGDEPGTVRIYTSVRELRSADLATLTLPYEITEGLYVVMEVQDTGTGMDEVTITKIFDPFFTTKFQGRGLGLSAVQGIIRGHKGALKVDSAPGKGTTFQMFLPALQQPVAALPVDPIPSDLRGRGTILVVDDEPIVRATACHALRKYGYSVLEAEDGRVALRVFLESPQIDVVLLDLTMPMMSGEETLHEMKRIRPEIKIILTSGFNEVEATRHFTGGGLAGFLQKPYTARALATQVKTALER